MRVRDGSDDGEAKAKAVLRAGPVDPEAFEGLDELVDPLLIERWASQPGVASLGSSTTTTAPSSTSQNAPFAIFGSCMRSHGEPQFQNPIVSGKTVGFQVTPSLGISTPRYARAAAACRRYLPPGPPPPPGMQQITQAAEVDYLKAVACVRNHGFPSVPDPTFIGRRRPCKRAEYLQELVQLSTGGCNLPKADRCSVAIQRLTAQFRVAPSVIRVAFGTSYWGLRGLEGSCNSVLQ